MGIASGVHVTLVNLNIMGKLDEMNILIQLNVQMFQKF